MSTIAWLFIKIKEFVKKVINKKINEWDRNYAKSYWFLVFSHTDKRLVP